MFAYRAQSPGFNSERYNQSGFWGSSLCPEIAVKSSLRNWGGQGQKDAFNQCLRLRFVRHSKEWGGSWDSSRVRKMSLLNRSGEWVLGHPRERGAAVTRIDICRGCSVCYTEGRFQWERLRRMLPYHPMLVGMHFYRPQRCTCVYHTHADENSPL